MVGYGDEGSARCAIGRSASDESAKDCRYFEDVRIQLSLEGAYNILFQHYADIVSLASTMKNKVQYSPFEHVIYPFRSLLCEVRKSLIEHSVRRWQAIYAPNVDTSDVDFGKFEKAAAAVEGVVDDNGKDLFFSEKPIETYFKSLAQNVPLLRELSMKNLQNLTNGFLPYGYDAKHEWCRESNPNAIREGATLTLHVYAWSGGLVNWNLNSRGEFAALHKIIEFAAMNASIETPVQETQLVNFINAYRDKPIEFFTKHGFMETSANRVLDSFQFFKNGKLKIKFKKEEFAKLAAECLVGENIIVTLTGTQNQLEEAKKSE